EEVGAARSIRYQDSSAWGRPAKRTGMEFPRNSRGCSALVMCVNEQGDHPMADDRMKRGSQDRSRISMEQEHEIRYWTQELGVSEAVLTAAVAKVGNSAEAVRRELRHSM